MNIHTYLKEKDCVFLLLALGIILFFFYNLLIPSTEQQFFLLAKSFTQGHLYLGPATISSDASYYNGYAYWPQGVFPAMLLAPFVFFFHGLVHQGSVQFALNLLNIWLLYKIALKITKNKTTSLWLAFSYIFATAYFVVGLVPWSWWYAQVVATSGLLLMLYEYFHARKWWLIGIYSACALATRIDLILILTFPLLLLVFSRQNYRSKVANALVLLAPVFFGLAFIAWYNFVRFGSVLEFGYGPHIPAIPAQQLLLHQYGTWNLFYVPTNFYYLFLSGLQGVFVPGTGYLTFPFFKPSPWGMSIFLTSPIFLWCLKTRSKEIVVRVALVTFLLILFFLLGFFTIGVRQYGFRYALDFQPFLFIILCFAFQRKMGKWVKIVIVISFFLNLFLFPTIFGSPLS